MIGEDVHDNDYDSDIDWFDDFNDDDDDKGVLIVAKGWVWIIRS